MTQAYLDGLTAFLKAHPDSPAAPEAVRQIVLLYEPQGKDVEAEAWRAKLPKDSSLTKPPDDANLQQAEKELGMAEYYRRTGRTDSAFFHYEAVQRRYPGTSYAKQAQERRDSLRAEVGRE